MRAIECAEAGCQHIHAQDDDALTRLLLQHTHQAHPDVRLDEQAAERLIDESGYNDEKHARKPTLASTLRGDDGPWL